MKRQEKVDAIIFDYLQRNPLKADTVYVPGMDVHHWDTIVNENIYTDTVRIEDTIFVHQTKWRDLVQTIRVVDTVIYTVISDNGRAAIAKENDTLKERLKDALSDKRSYLIAIVMLASFILLYIAYRLF